MLVSSIARLNAVNTMNNAAFMALSASNSMISGVNNTHAFEGERNLVALNQAEKTINASLLTNNLLYKISSLQEKFSAKKQSNELKNSLDLMA